MAKIGPMPTGRRYKGVPVPFFFQEETAAAFQAMEVHDSDVFLISLMKGGTTWTEKIVWLMLHGIADDGSIKTPVGPAAIGSEKQVYPEALDLTRRAAEPGSQEEMRHKLFGTHGFLDDLCEQPAPRLFATHMWGRNLLPHGLFDEPEFGGDEAAVATEGSGRMIVVVRNLKDVLASLHFFRGEAKDGWLGNEHGPGSFARFLAGVNAYGSTFDWIKAMDEVSAELSKSGRVCIVYFEALKLNLKAQLRKIATFLGVRDGDAKIDAVAAAVGFKTMKAARPDAETMRKGGIGDWRNHLDAETWAEFDHHFESTLGNCALAEPLRWFQHWSVAGLPPTIAEQKEQLPGGDARTWGSWDRVVLQDGMIVRDAMIPSIKDGGTFVRPPSEFNGTLTAPGSGGGADAPFVAEAGRYHLFLSGVCPWASSVRATIELLQLQDMITVDVSDGQSGGGWIFYTRSKVEPWSLLREDPTFYLHEVYQASDPFCSARITVPVLWDCKTKTIVSNDSWDIVQMLSTAFLPLAAAAAVEGAPPPLVLCPPGEMEAMEALHVELKATLLNGVYRAGINLVRGNEEQAAKGRQDVFAALAKVFIYLFNWKMTESFTNFILIKKNMIIVDQVGSFFGNKKISYGRCHHCSRPPPHDDALALRRLLFCCLRPTPR